MSAPDSTALAPIVLPRNRATAAFERRVARALAPHVDREASVVVACSGGPDSLATLVAVVRAGPPERVTAAHFDHRLRPAAEVARERALVERVAAALGAHVVSARAPRVPADHGEAAAREARYRWLARACRDAGAAVCVTGHTLDDQAETVLLRLVRGTGLGGAAGMASRSDWPVPVRGRAVPTLVRPLLGIERAEVETYLAALGLDAAQDPSNVTTDYARNRVRQQVIPELRRLNPRAAAQIAAFADLARADEAALDAWAAAALVAVTLPTVVGIGLDARALLDLPVAIATRVIRRAAAGLGVMLDRAPAEAALHAARARGRRAALGQGVEAWRDGAALLLGRPPGARAKDSKKTSSGG